MPYSILFWSKQLPVINLVGLTRNNNLYRIKNEKYVTVHLYLYWWLICRHSPKT